jgi:autotransporter-associated beta strand protein
MKLLHNIQQLKGTLRGLARTLPVMAVASLGVAPFAKAAPPVTSGLVLHMDASQITTPPATGTQLDTWTDVSTAGNNAIRQATSSTGFPKYVTNGLNGLPVVRFASGNAVGDHFRFNRISTIRSAFWVLKDDGLGDRFFLGDSLSSQFYRGTSGNTKKFWHNEFTSSFIRSGVTKLMGNPVNGVNTELPLGSFQLISLVTTGNVEANQICQDRAVTGSWVGDIAEILIYDRALDETEEKAIGTYLSTKYQLVTTYPVAGVPAVPTDVAAIPISTGKITLNWSPVFSAASYSVSYKTTAGGTEVVVPNITAPTYSISGLTNGTSYDFKVLAENAAGPGVYSPVVSAVPAVSSEKSILSFVVPGQPDGLISGTNIAVTVPTGTDVTALTPIYTLSGVATGSPASGSVLNFTTPQTYLITAEDTSTKTYTVTVTQSAVASTFTWTTGTSGTWGDGSKWINNLADGFRPSITGASYYTFNFDQAATATNDLSANFAVNKMNFSNLVKIEGNSVALSANGAVLPQINQNSNNLVTFNTPLILAADTTFGGSSTGGVVINRAISGSGKLIKSSVNQPMTLNAANTYSGGTLISGGTLACGLSVASPLGTAVNVTIQAGGTLSMDRNQITGSLTLNGGLLAVSNGWADDRWTGPITLESTSTIDVGFSDGSIYLNGVVSGAGGLIKLGTSPRPMHFLGSNTFTGPITISAGSVVVDGTGLLGAGAYAGVISLAVPATNFTYSGTAAQTLSGVISGTGSLTKTATSTLSLTGANSYTGTTTVSGGILAVNGNALSNAGKLVINSGTVQAAGTETVGTLFFGATQQSVGTWGATGSGATNIDDTHFSGTAGKVLVTSGPGGVSDYSTWAAVYLPADVSNPALDADGDGMSNLQEYAFGLSPVSGASVNPISDKLSKATGLFSYTRRATTGLTYTVSTSTDLVTWTLDAAATQTVTSTALGIETVKVTLSAAVPLTATKIFVRVKATQ